MTFGTVVDPVMVPFAFGVAVISALMLFRHIARRYASVPARVPWRIKLDGRPSQRTVTKATLWVAPVVLAAVLAFCGSAAFAFARPPAEQRLVVVGVFTICAELAWYTAWLTDRQIEIARKMTYRIAPARLLRATAPLLLTVALVLALAVRT